MFYYCINSKVNYIFSPLVICKAQNSQFWFQKVISCNFNHYLSFFANVIDRVQCKLHTRLIPKLKK